jgi:hypothetical protein
LQEHGPALQELAAGDLPAGVPLLQEVQGRRSAFDPHVRKLSPEQQDRHDHQADPDHGGEETAHPTPVVGTPGPEHALAPAAQVVTDLLKLLRGDLASGEPILCDADRG